MKAIFVLLGFAMILLFLRIVPIGTAASHENGRGFGMSIERPKYLIPREIKLTGFPLPGGEIGLLSDPHFSFSPTSTIVSVDGSPVISARAFTINSGFERADLSQEIILLRDWIHNSTFEYEVSGIGLDKTYHQDSIYLISADDTFVYVLVATSGSDGDIFIVRLEIRGLYDVTVVSKRSRFDWEIAVRNIPVTRSHAEQRRFCESTWRPVLSFWTESLGAAC